MSDEEPTDPRGEPPPSPHPSVTAAERFAQLVGVMLQPLREQLNDINVATSQTQEFVAKVVRDIAALKERVGKLEKRVTALESRPPDEAA